MADNFLEHYGVKGMKWGVRRYQPYPNGSKKGIYLGDSVGHQPLKYKSPMVRTITSYTKKLGHATLAQLIPGYALAYNTSQIHRNVKYNLDGTNYVKKQGDYESLSSLTKKAVPTSSEEDAKLVNKGNSKGRVNNCGFCTATMEMRRRGYDVEARKKAKGITSNQYDDWFDGLVHESSHVERLPGQSRKEWVIQNYNQLCKKIEAKGNGSRGYVAFQYQKFGSGHTLFWEVFNGEVTFYDGQSGKKNPGDVFSFSDQRYEYGRLDNCKLKSDITETCISRDYKKKYKEKTK